MRRTAAALRCGALRLAAQTPSAAPLWDPTGQHSGISRAPATAPKPASGALSAVGCCVLPRVAGAVGLAGGAGSPPHPTLLRPPACRHRAWRTGWLHLTTCHACRVSNTPADRHACAHPGRAGGHRHLTSSALSAALLQPALATHRAAACCTHGVSCVRVACHTHAGRAGAGGEAVSGPRGCAGGGEACTPVTVRNRS